jgi:hypothetical protein
MQMLTGRERQDYAYTTDIILSKKNLLVLDLVPIFKVAMPILTSIPRFTLELRRIINVERNEYVDSLFHETCAYCTTSTPRAGHQNLPLLPLQSVYSRPDEGKPDRSPSAKFREHLLQVSVHFPYFEKNLKCLCDLHAVCVSAYPSYQLLNG